MLSTNEYKSILGYLPSTIIKNVIEKRVDLSKQLPQHYITDSVGLFSDISGFTKLSEAFSKKGRVGAECLTFCINRYMEQIINIIGANGGDIFKFVGDAIMVIWPPDDSPNFLETACKRAVQCACDIQNKLNNLEIVKGKFLSVKIGLGVGQCHILFVGGLFGRCEYLCVGEAMRQACESETHASGGGQILMSELVQRHVIGSYNFIKAEVQPGYSATDNLTYYMIDREGSDQYGKGNKVMTKADAFLMRKLFDKKRIKEKLGTLRTFLPAGVKSYLNIDKETWCKEIRLITSMFLNIKIDLSQLKDESAFQKVQSVANTVQRCIYRTRGALNKFLMDDKGSVMLMVWGIPPYSSRDDPLSCVCSCMTILAELKKLGLKCGMGVATGTCFTGVCGTVGGRREYSLLGEIVNLSSRYMSKGLEYMKKNNLDSILVIDEKTKDLIQNKIRCKYLLTSQLKGFTVDFNFFQPLSENEPLLPSLLDPFPFIRTHHLNSIPFLNNTIRDDKDDLSNSLSMIGRRSELKYMIKKLNAIFKNNMKKIITIRGQYGSGKSLFIRRSLYDFFKTNKELGVSYFNFTKYIPKPNVVLCSYQYPIMQFVPFNGVAFIFRQIYQWMDENVFQKEETKHLHCDKYSFEIIGDSFVELLIKSNCLEYIECIEEMLNSTREDIIISKHFNREFDYENIAKLQFSYGATGKKRDPFFAKYPLNDTKPVITFLVNFLIMYRNQVDKVNGINNARIPLILVIEDTQQIDEYSISFIEHMLNHSYKELKPITLILSYQEQLRCIKQQNDLIGIHKELIPKMSLEEFINDNNEDTVASITIPNITDIDEIEELIKNYVIETGFFERIDSLFKVDPILIDILIDKSFGGIPLFIRDLFEQFVKLGYIQNCVEEILITSELEDMERSNNWNDLVIPLRIEKVCGEMIDSLREKDIIILKHASIIGTTFDIQTLYQILPFTNLQVSDLYHSLKTYEDKGILEFLYDLDPKLKRVVCKFSFPFFKETLYQRMLTEQKSETHMMIGRILQKSKLSYLPYHIERKTLERHLEDGQESLIVKMEDTGENKKRHITNTNSLKILLVKEIYDKLRDNQLNNEEEEFEGKGKEKLNNAIKYGMIDKKSDGKITWESRFFVMTAKTVRYYYKMDEFLNDCVPLATFDLKDIYNIQQLKDGSFGNRKNIFEVSVTKWIKKEIPKGHRTYIFSCKSVEELYRWLISLNFVKVNAYYDFFVSNFGLVKFPLNPTDKIKKKKYDLRLENIEGFQKVFKSTSPSKRRLSFGQEIVLENKEIVDAFKTVVSYGFSVILGNIQGNITKKKNEEEEDAGLIKKREIVNPTHLTIFKEESKESQDDSLSNVINRKQSRISSSVKNQTTEKKSEEKSQHVQIVDNNIITNQPNIVNSAPIKKEEKIEEHKIYEKNSITNTNAVITTNLLNNNLTTNEEKFESSVLEKLKTLNLSLDLDDKYYSEISENNIHKAE